ncbi:hypothetical protein AB0J57_27465 [Streptomyces sp. NPDC049837]|uniref:hypothetical protein n=1 Tax=Streptomyces sp. NPDC049837 TaxID=3155277 RepID=UPI00342FFC4D
MQRELAADPRVAYKSDGCLYRFVPTTRGDLSRGTLQVQRGTMGSSSGGITYEVTGPFRTTL